MGVKRTILVPKDGRSKDKKGLTERHHIQMDDKVITLFRYTNKSHIKTRTWNMRCYLDGRTHQKNTKTDDLKESIKISKRWYGEMLSRMDEGIETERLSKDPHLFTEVGEDFLEECRKSSDNGTNHKHYFKDHNLTYRNYIEPFFRNDQIEKIDTPRLVQWEKWRDKQRIKSPDLSHGRLKKEYTTIYQILKRGVELGYLKQLPVKPQTLLKMKRRTKKDPERGWFTGKEYKKLLQVSRKRVEESKKKWLLQKRLKKDKTKKSFGGHWEGIYRDRLYLHYYIILLTSTGTRPGELMTVRHKGVTKVDDDDEYKVHLVLTVEGKTQQTRRVVSRYSGYYGYEGLVKNVCPDHNPNDFLFPTSPRNGFRELLEESGLRYSSNGDKRDSKSLRHSYLMWGCLSGESVTFLEKNTGVSPQIMKDHYLRHLSTVSKSVREVLIQPSKIRDI
jgi:hypothetical protein